MEMCTTNGTLKINFLQPCKNKFLKYSTYEKLLLANFRLNHFKSLVYRKLANIRKYMQIRKPFVQKNEKNCFLYKFLGKLTLPQIVFLQFPIFVTI